MQRLVHLVVPATFCLAAFAWGNRSTSAQGPACLASTSVGDVQGLDQGSACAFLGVPFAAPPLASLRWKAPQPAAPWAPGSARHDRAADMRPAECCERVAVWNEDRLKLNVWTPNPLPLVWAPVIVWLHPGAFSAHQPISRRRTAADWPPPPAQSWSRPIIGLGRLDSSATRRWSTEGKVLRGTMAFSISGRRFLWVRDHIAAFGGTYAT